MNRSWVEINANALRANIHVLGSQLEPGTEFCAVVKSNAYGHDLDTIVRLAALEGVRLFAVDSVDEAILVKKRAPTADVFILGFTLPDRFADVVQHNLIQTVYDDAALEALADAALKQQTRARVNIKIETGTKRQGIDLQKLSGFLSRLQRRASQLEFASVSSHFANSEEAENPSFCAAQQDVFIDALELIAAAGFEPPYRHIACSAAAILYPATHHTVVRYGISMYGLWSSESLRSVNRTSARAIDLAPVMSVKTTVAQIKDVRTGESVGYGRSFVADRAMRIAVLPVGYYDGYRRANARKSHVLLYGQKCRVIGNICMNMMMIDVSTLPQVKVGDTVTILGRDGMNMVTADMIAEWCGTIHYEIVTGISPHLPRIVV